MTRMGKAMRMAAVVTALGIGLGMGFGGGVAAAAERTAPHVSVAQQATGTATDLSAQRRAPTRIRVHPRYQRLGPHAVRDCSATYVQEFRPSGTVIVPRMHCVWRQG